MSSRFTRNLSEVKDVNKLAEHVTTQNDLVQTTEGDVFVVTKNGYEKITGGLTLEDIEPLKTDIESLETSNSEQAKKIKSLETTNSEQATKISDLETSNTDLISRIDALETINVTGVKLDKSTLSLEEGATGNLVATISPENATDKTVSFTSSDKAIATVDDKGKVTGVKAGSADITVTTKDGSKTAKCTITVKAKSIAVTGVKLDKSTLSLEEGATGNLVATISPENATDKTVSFTSSDKAIATVDDKGKVTGVKAGSADITVTTKDGSKTAKCALTVTDNSDTTE